MNAIILRHSGGTENFFYTDQPVPSPGPKEVLIRTKAISINPVDVKTRKGGAFYGPLAEAGPVILGWDVSGVVVEAGSEVERFRKGDEVFGMINFPGNGKAYAEYVAAPEEHLALKPAQISHAEAAAATLAALTAWQVLVHQAGIRSGQRLLVHAAAGGVGHYAVQIAKHFGLEVTGTSSAANADFLKDLGIDHHIDYHQQDVYAETGTYEVILDPLGGENTVRSLDLLRPGGVLISIVGGVKDHLQPLIREKGIEARNYLVHSNGKDQEELAKLLESGRIKSFVSQAFDFRQIEEAHQQVESGKTRGKIVLELDAE